MLDSKTINVTEKNIHHGICEDKERCAIALALADAYKYKIDYVEVEGYNSIKMSSPDDIWFQVNINPEDHMRLSNFIEDFDHNKNVKPMSFKIDSIEEY
jgi:hypothetical protein